MTTTTYDVTGMTCAHCVSAVSGELAKLVGVTDVAVDLNTGQVTVISETALDPHAVRAAIAEVGYELTGFSEAPS